MDGGTEHILCRFADDAKLRRLKHQMGVLLFKETLKDQQMGP